MTKNNLKKRALSNGSVALYSCDCSGCGCNGCGCGCTTGANNAYINGSNSSTFTNNTTSSKTSPISLN